MHWKPAGVSYVISKYHEL